MSEKQKDIALESIYSQLENCDGSHTDVLNEIIDIINDLEEAGVMRDGEVV